MGLWGLVAPEGSNLDFGSHEAPRSCTVPHPVQERIHSSAAGSAAAPAAPCSLCMPCKPLRLDHLL